MASTPPTSQPPIGGGFQTNYIEKSKFIGKEDRLTFSHGEKESDTICSIRIEKLPTQEVGSQPPQLSAWKQRNWVILKVGSETVLANINSIAELTGLTKKEIRSANNLELLLFGSINIAAGIKSELAYEKTATVKCDANGNPNASDLMREFQLTPTQYLNVKGHISETIDNGDGTFSKELTLLKHPGEKELTKMVGNVHKFRREIMATGATTKAKQDNPVTNENLHKKDWKLKGSFSLTALVSTDGQMYLSSLSKKVGSGGFNTVVSGVKVSSQGSHEQVVFGIPRSSMEVQTEEQRAELREKYDSDVNANRLHNLVQSDHVVKHHGCFVYDTHSMNPKENSIGFVQSYGGEDLRRNISGLQDLPIQEKVESFSVIITGLAQGLNDMHKAGVYHRDIKLDNIVLTKDEEGKIKKAAYIDFGFATDKKTTDDLSGTFGYFSPQMWEDGEHSTAGDDLWALGTSLYKMLDPNGVPHFEDGVLFEKLMSNPKLPFSDLTVTEQDRVDFLRKDYIKSHNLPTDTNLKTVNIRLVLKEKLIADSKTHFGVERPARIEGETNDSILTEWKILSWDMLFASPKLTAEEVLQRVNEINIKIASSQPAPQTPLA